jgi:general stress protein 26
MGRVLNDAGEDEWTIRFLTDGRSRKARDMRSANEVAIVFQHEQDLAFVTLIGKAALHDSASEVSRRWKRAYDVYFPTETDRANAIFVEIYVRRIELWIQGVTPEPFGLRATAVERGAGGDWRVIQT